MNICEYIYSILPATLKPKFVGEVPSQSEEGIAIALTDGEDSDLFFGSGATLARPYVQIVVRTKEYAKGSKFCNQIIETLDRYKQESEGILGLWMQGNIDYLGKTEEKLHEFELTFKSMLLERSED